MTGKDWVFSPSTVEQDITHKHTHTNTNTHTHTEEMDSGLIEQDPS